MIESGFLAALFILMVIFLMPVISRELRQKWSILSGYWFVITLHQVVAFTNTFLFVTIGADADAATFHRIGTELAQSRSFIFAIGSEFYANLLGVLYWLLGPSHLLGQQLSILAFAVSCIVLMKILRLLGLICYRVPILLAFGILPTMILVGSITLRESYQVLFFMLAVYFGIKMHIKGGINFYLIALVISSLVMGLFHRGLIAYAVFLIILFMVWPFRPASQPWNVKKSRLIAVLTLPALIAGIVILSKIHLYSLDVLTTLVNMDLSEAALIYRENSPMSRASYGVILDFSSTFTAIYTSFVLYLYYLFSPFPWQVSSVLDIYASMESTLRMILIYMSVKHWHNAYGMQRRLLGLMLILFFSMSIMWAMGTSNYGTAIRHHMLSWWIIVIVGLPPLIENLRRVRLGSTLRKRIDSVGHHLENIGAQK